MDITLICTVVGPMLALFGAFSALMLWMMSRMETRLHTDLTGIRDDVSGANKRIDAMGARIDQTQAIIMRMLEREVG